MPTITRPKRTQKNHPVMAFDVETIGPDRKFVCGCFQDKGGQFFTRSRQELASRLTAAVNAGGIIYATNLFYDFTATFKGFPAPSQALFAGARLIRVHWKVPGARVIRFYDTSNLTNRMSVKSLGKMVGLAKLDTPEVLIDPSSAGLIPDDLPPVRMAEIEEYNRRDTEITYRWALRFQKVCKSLGCEVKTTIASTALDLWKRQYMHKGLHTPPKWMNEWYREAYHGGLVFVFKRGFGKAVTYYDIRSLYPYVLADRPYPDCASVRIVRGEEGRSHILGQEGFSRCLVRYPDCYFPVLPVVVKGCLLTCSGEYSGLWTHFELREAVKRGAEILEVYDTAYFTRTITPLKTYMEDLYRHRTAASEDGDGFEGVYKLFMNALSGKFGQRYDGTLYEPIDVEAITDPADLEGIVTVQCGNVEYYIRPKGIAYDPKFINVAWAAYMTAYARMHEIEYLEEAFPNVYACDTDSVFTTHRFIQGDELGDMGLKEEPRDWVFLFPKQYASWSSEGVWTGKIKGVPVVGQDTYFREGSYTWIKPATFKEAASLGVTPGDWIARTRTDKPKHDKRVYLKDVDPRSGCTDSRPFTYQEAREYFSRTPAGEDWRETDLLLATDVLEDLQLSYMRSNTKALIAELRASCTIPAATVFATWDYKQGKMRRRRSRSGMIITWDKGLTDDVATELGFSDDREFAAAVARQVKTYDRIRQLESTL